MFAGLSDAILIEAVLDQADLSDALGIPNDKLEQQAYSLEGATKPDDRNYDEWLIEKEGSGRIERTAAHHNARNELLKKPSRRSPTSENNPSTHSAE